MTRRNEPEQRRYSNPYKGELRRIDGTPPSDPNHYLWPLEADWYWARKELGDRYTSRWHFSAVALADGRWLSDGFVRHDESLMRFFQTREGALRHSGAELIRTIRSARNWPRGYMSDWVSPEQYVELVDWIMTTLDRPPMMIKVKPAAAPRPWADLPLFSTEAV